MVENLFVLKHMSLKKTVIIFTLAIITCTSTNAQNFEYGFELGLGVSAIHMSNVPLGITYTRMYNPIAIYNINGFVSYKSNSFWGLSVEPGIIQKGGIQLYNYRNSRLELIHNNVFVVEHYIQLPILYNIYWGKRMYFSVGPELAYRLSEDAGITNTVNNSDYSISAYKSLGNLVIADYILPDAERRLEISGVLGLNCSMTKKFDVGIRYSYGFHNLVDVTWENNYGSLLGHSLTHNQYLQFLMKLRI